MLTFRRPPFLAVWTLLLTAASAVGASAQDNVQWRTEAELDQQLERLVDLTWDDVPLRDGLGSLAASQRVAIFLDRRIDPDQLISLKVSDERLEQVLQRVALLAEAGVARVGDVMYVGPSETAGQLPTVAELQSQFARTGDSQFAANLLTRRSYRWERLTPPREILTDIAQAQEMTWTNLETVIPHDLWPEVNLPPLRTTELLTLVLAGFHASYRFQKTPDGVQLELVGIPENLALTKSYRYAGNHDEAITKIRGLYPEAKVESDGKQLAVTGSHEAQQAVAKLLRGGTVRRGMVTPGEKRYTLTVQQQPLGPVLKALAGQLGLEVVLPEGQDEALSKRTSFSVKEADLPGLLDAIFAESELGYRVEEERLIVTAPE